MAKVTRLTLDQDGGPGRRRLHLREISDDADAPLETVGQDLRAARQRKGEDLASVSAILKIRKDHLEALEECNLEALPGRTYAIGFVRSYSEYLGLDPIYFVERFKLEIAGRGEPDEIPTDDPDCIHIRPVPKDIDPDDPAVSDSDLNGDEVINWADLAIMAQQWGKQYEMPFTDDE